MNPEFFPCTHPLLKSLVLNYFTFSSRNCEEDLTLVPTGNQYILFHLAGEVNYSFRDRGICCRNKVALGYVHNSCSWARVAPDSKILAVTLKPYGIYQLLGREYNKEHFFISEVGSLPEENKMKSICQNLQEVSGGREQIRMVETFLSARYRKIRAGNLVQRFLEIMGNFEKVETTSEIATRLFTNQRTLELEFLRVTGVTPGKYIKLMRFKKVFEDYQLHDLSIKGLIQKYGYTDYSHLSRDFQKHTGATLKENSELSYLFYCTYQKAQKESLGNK